MNPFCSNIDKLKLDMLLERFLHRRRSLTAYNGFDYTHNLNGELIQKRDLNNNVTNYNWNSFGHLTGVTTGSLTINYKVDGIGRRVNKSIGAQSVRTWFYRNEIQIASELDENNNARAYFVYGSLPHVPDFMVMVGSNETYRFIHDQLGSIRMVVNASTGQIAQEIEYDEFGVVLRDTNPGFQPFGFAGGHYDHDTGLVHFGARSYDPGVGRWVSKDPIGFAGGDTNLYSYANQDSINFIDTSGEFAVAVVPALPVIARALVFATSSSAVSALVNEIINVFSKGGKQNIRDSEFANLSDKEVSARARDKTLPPEIRRKYQKEEKARGLRNKGKRSCD